MKLLIITRTIDAAHPLAGFAASWVREFGQQLLLASGRLQVITLEPSLRDGLPENVDVWPVRKDRKNRIKDFFLYLRLLARLVPQSDAVFIHQHPLYAIIAAPFAKLLRKKIYLWYVHKQVDIKLRIAVALVDGVFTASKESFRLNTRTPVRVVGHGIDTHIFSPPVLQRDNDRFIILSVGRISPVKGYEMLIGAVQQLIIRSHTPVSVRIVGGPGLAAHQGYFERLKQVVHERRLEEVIAFTGPIPHADVLREYHTADLFVSLSGTGSLDKAVLEAMACGVPVVTSNEAFQELLRPVDAHLYTEKNSKSVADAIARIVLMSPEARQQLGGKLRAAAVKEHDLKKLVSRLLTIMQEAV